MQLYSAVGSPFSFCLWGRSQSLCSWGPTFSRVTPAVKGCRGSPAGPPPCPPLYFWRRCFCSLFCFLDFYGFCFFLFPPVLPGLLFAGSLLFLFLIVVSRFLFSSRLLLVIGTIIFRRVHDFFEWTPCMLFLRPG